MSVVDAVHRDPYLSPEQKQTLLRVYESLRAAGRGGVARRRSRSRRIDAFGIPARRRRR